MRIAILSRNAALYSTTRLVLCGRARGHRVDVIDPLDLQLVVAKGTPKLCYAGQPIPRYDVVIPRIGSKSTRFGGAVVALFEQSGVPVLNGSEAITQARDKVGSLMELSKRRIAVPRTVGMRGMVGVERALALIGGCPAVVKLQHGTHGVGCMIADSESAVVSLVETMGAMGQEVMLQEYVPAPNGDLRAFVVDGEVVAAMRRRPQKGEFRSNLHRGGKGEAVRLLRPYRRCAERAAAAVGLSVAGVDMLETEAGPVVLELNASPGLEGIEQVTEIDVAAHVLIAAEARKPRRRRSPRPRASA
jgi:ribosomal protein S6--L-glutamate ligase